MLTVTLVFGLRWRVFLLPFKTLGSLCNTLYVLMFQANHLEPLPIWLYLLLLLLVHYEFASKIKLQFKRGLAGSSSAL